MNKIWSDESWADYLYWQTEDKKTLRKINELIKDVFRNPYTGLGKPEPLRGNLAGLWSRRIDHKNRLLYRITEAGIEIVSCRTHYDEK